MAREEPGGQDPLSHRQVEQVVELLDRAYSAGDNLARRRSLAEGLAGLLRADHWLWMISTHDGESAPIAVNLIHSDLSEKQVGLLMEATQDPDHPPPEYPARMRELADGRPFTRRRSDWVDDQTWFGSEHYKLYREPMDFDEFIYAIYPIDHGTFSSLALHRKPGREAFSPAERRLAHIVITNVRSLHESAVPGGPRELVPELTPRLRTVFGLLMNGWTRKRIAAHLGISPNTVAEYQTKIYRHFGVKSQSQLLAKLTLGDGGDIPSSGG